MDDPQVSQYCHNWCQFRRRDKIYLADLQSAISELAVSTSADRNDEALSTNPLMLTAICMVHERYRNLPEDRARLCSLLVDDLCRSRRSEDVESDWKLDEAGKRDLLQRIAYAMQLAGAQTWPVDRATELALKGVGQAEVNRFARAERHLHWAADHTGLLRFHQTESGVEELRFWHRLFREFLAASRLAQEDYTTSDLMEKLDHDGHLQDPNWQDVVCLLPSALGTAEKAEKVLSHLRSRATLRDTSTGRYWGLAISAVVESRELFAGTDPKQLAADAAAAFADAIKWPMADRVLFLDGLGRLDRNIGGLASRDGRFFEAGGVRVYAGSMTDSRSEHAGVPQRSTYVAKFAISWLPVTVQEYEQFVEASDRASEEWWVGIKKSNRIMVCDAATTSWRRQLRHPNHPVGMITWLEANAYCRWRSAQLPAEEEVWLPTLAEYRALRFSQDLRDIRPFRGPLPPVGACLELLDRKEIEMTGIEWTSSTAADLLGSAVRDKPNLGRSEFAVAHLMQMPTETTAPRIEALTAGAQLRHEWLTFRLRRALTASSSRVR